MAKKQKSLLRKDDPKNFAEFVKWAVIDVHNALITEGGQGLSASFYRILPYYEAWIKRLRGQN